MDLVPAVPSDARLLFDWVNSPDNLRQSLRTAAPIAWEDHVAWLERKLASDTALIRIAWVDDVPVGQVRAERGDDGLAVAIYVVPTRRGGGTGVAMMQALAVACADRWPGVPLVAKIRLGNEASRRMCVRAGYMQAAIADDHVELRLTPTPGAAG